jgi:hypothetical protein
MDEGENQAPNAEDDAYTAVTGETLVIGAADGVLVNDTDPEGDDLQARVTAGPPNGTLDLLATGGFEYTPNADFSGTDSFEYEATDPDGASGTATATLTVESTPPTVAEDIENIEAALDEAVTRAETLEQGAFSRRLRAFLGLSAGEVQAQRFVESVLTDDVIDLLTLRENAAGDPVGFDFAASQGEYVWNADSETWEAGESSTDVVLRGPGSESAASNNAVLTVRDYADTRVTINGEDAFLPARVDARVVVDGDEVAAVRLSEVTYDTGGDVPIPVDFDLEIVTAPFTHTVSVTQVSSTSFTLNVGISNAASEVVFGTTATLTLASDDYETLDNEDFENGTLTVNLGSGLTVEATGDIGTLLSLRDLQVQDVNDEVDATVRFMGRQVGTLRYDESAEDLVIDYRDGSTDPTSRFYEPVLEELDAIFRDYIGT